MYLHGVGVELKTLITFHQAVKVMKITVFFKTGMLFDGCVEERYMWQWNVAPIQDIVVDLRGSSKISLEHLAHLEIVLWRVDVFFYLSNRNG